MSDQAHILFEQPVMIFSPVANFGQHPLRILNLFLFDCFDLHKMYFSLRIKVEKNADILTCVSLSNNQFYNKQLIKHHEIIVDSGLGF